MRVASISGRGNRSVGMYYENTEKFPCTPSVARYIAPTTKLPAPSTLRIWRWFPWKNGQYVILYIWMYPGVYLQLSEYLMNITIYKIPFLVFIWRVFGNSGIWTQQRSFRSGDFFCVIEDCCTLCEHLRPFWQVGWFFVGFANIWNNRAEFEGVREA